MRVRVVPFDMNQHIKSSINNSDHYDKMGVINENVYDLIKRQIVGNR